MIQIINSISGVTKQIHYIIYENMKKQLNGNFLFYYYYFNYFSTISYDKALQIDSNFSEAWNNKGNALHILKKYEKVIEW